MIKKVDLTPVDLCLLTLLQGECSYVSLRDVDRTMTVFKFFYDQINGALGKQMNASVPLLTRLRTRKFTVKVLQLTTNLHYPYRYM